MDLLTILHDSNCATASLPCPGCERNRSVKKQIKAISQSIYHKRLPNAIVFLELE
jgi:hypothetical protein